MQAILRRQMMKQISRNSLRVVSTQFIQQRTMFSVPQFRFSDELGYDRISNYENLISRITNSDKIEDILDTFDSNEELMKNEHIVLSLRMIARLVRGNSSDDNNSLSGDERYIRLTKKAVSVSETLNEYEVLDFLFWMRKFKFSGIPINFDSEALDAFFKRIEEFLVQKSFNFRNLVNLYYDYTFLNRNCEQIVANILREIKIDSKIITTFTVIQILQSASRKRGSLSSREYLLVDTIAFYFANNIDEFDTDQKCVIFKYTASIEQNINPPRFRTPILLNNLRQSLKDKIDQLSESSVLNILNAYQYLPRDFRNDLLIEIKEMVYVTIQHNPTNIKSFFLLDFIDNSSNFKGKRRLNSEQSHTLSQEIAKRLSHDSFLQRSKNLERIVGFYQRGFRSQELLEALTEFQKGKEFLYFPILELLQDQKHDISELIENNVNMELSEKQSYQMCRLYLLISEYPEKYAEKIAQFKSQIDEIIETDPKRVLGSLNVTHKQNDACNELILACIKSLKEKNQENHNNYKLYQVLLNTSKSQVTRIAWMQDIQSFFSSTQNFFQFLAALDRVDYYKFSHITLFLTVMELEGANDKIIKKAIQQIANSAQFMQEFLRQEHFFLRFVSLIRRAKRQYPDVIRIFPLISLILRCENQNFRYENLNNLSQQIMTEIMVDQEKFLTTELTVAQFMLQKQLLNSKNAELVYNKYENNSISEFLKLKLLLQAQSNYKDNDQWKQNPETQEFIEVMYEKQKSKLESLSNTNAQLNQIAQILTFPFQIIEQDLPQFTEILQNNLQNASTYAYMNVLFALNPIVLRANAKAFGPFIKVISKHYPEIVQKIELKDHVKIISQFTKLGQYNPNIYNASLQVFGDRFNDLYIVDRVQLLSCFARMKIKQEDFFQKNLEILTNKRLHTPNLVRQIFQSLFTVGFVEENQGQFIKTLAYRNRVSNAYIESVDFLKLIVIQRLDNEEEFISEFLKDCKEVVYDRPPNGIHSLVKYLKFAYPAKPEYYQTIQNRVQNYQEKVNEKTQRFINSTQETISKYLDQMKIEYTQDHQIEDEQIPLYIASQNIIICPVRQASFNFDKTSHPGFILLQQRIYEAQITGVKVIWLNFNEFKYNGDHLDKINYLESLGVKNCNESADYDFSQISPEEQKVVEESIIEGEDADDLDLDLSAVDEDSTGGLDLETPVTEDQDLDTAK